MKEQINNLLQSFEPITLEEMDNVKLMNRFDTRYSFSINSLPVFIEMMKDSYRILEVNGFRISRYESFYFDTKDFNLYFNHHRGKLNRYKLRFRSYVESNIHFFEIKFKNNKGKTIKNRIEHPRIETNISGPVKEFLQEHSSIDPKNLEHKLRTDFSRMTFVNRFRPERVTIDIDLSFSNGNEKRSMQNLVIAEVKQEKPFVSAFVRMMKDHHIRQGGLSKYCFGVMEIFAQQRSNNFKRQLLHLNKYIYGTSTRT